ncbi:MAG TPA: FAD-binding protein [Candidatus Sulfotelmatobacter sp.]|nr:FAD-binding protein [Candidatus Sulfotelmatobacter sp.]
MTDAQIAIAGVVPRRVVTPRDVDELRALLVELNAARAAFAFVGGGTELELGNAPRALDTVVRTNALRRVVDYAPEDQTITVEAGITFAELDAVLAEHGQMLPLDVLDRTRATVGGALATNAYGARRQRYGTAKDLIVGVRVVRPDGTPARGGGKVVKNVAGFDLPKLAVGSLGTLFGIVEATLRVYPVPAARTTLTYALPARETIAAASRAFTAQRLEPETFVVHDGRTLTVEMAGTAAGVAEQCAAADAALRALGATPAEPPAVDAQPRAWRARAVTPPSRTPAGEITFPLLGVALRASDEPFDLAAMRRAASAVVVHALPPSARAQVDVWGPPPPSFPLMQALKANFDPRGLCNPGRFVGGL